MAMPSHDMGVPMWIYGRRRSLKSPPLTICLKGLDRFRNGVLTRLADHSVSPLLARDAVGTSASREDTHDIGCIRTVGHSFEIHCPLAEANANGPRIVECICLEASDWPVANCTFHCDGGAVLEFQNMKLDLSDGQIGVGRKVRAPAGEEPRDASHDSTDPSTPVTTSYGPKHSEAGGGTNRHPKVRILPRRHDRDPYTRRRSAKAWLVWVRRRTRRA
jgi:hypothetical protein